MLASALKDLASGAEARRALGWRDKRQRANLNPSKRVALPATWLAELRGGVRGPLVRRIAWGPPAPEFTIATDASPWGLDG
eukprot:14715403-Alexandrium_andersonii.AAC.1